MEAAGPTIPRLLPLCFAQPSLTDVKRMQMIELRRPPARHRLSQQKQGELLRCQRVAMASECSISSQKRVFALRSRSRLREQPDLLLEADTTATFSRCPFNCWHRACVSHQGHLEDDMVLRRSSSSSAGIRTGLCGSDGASALPPLPGSLAAA